MASALGSPAKSNAGDSDFKRRRISARKAAETLDCMVTTQQKLERQKDLDSLTELLRARPELMI
eukprot:14043649-Alexandrium_andersonii.AAC.1